MVVVYCDFAFDKSLHFQCKEYIVLKSFSETSQYTCCDNAHLHSTWHGFYQYHAALMLKLPHFFLFLTPAWLCMLHLFLLLVLEMPWSVDNGVNQETFTAPLPKFCKYVKSPLYCMFSNVVHKQKLQTFCKHFRSPN